MIFSRFWKSPAYMLIGVVFILLLPACSSQQVASTETVSEAATPLPVTGPAATIPASPVPEEPFIAATSSPDPAASASPVETEAVLLFDGIPQGQTPEGFPFLGSPDAPVTLVDYSDFL